MVTSATPQRAPAAAPAGAAPRLPVRFSCTAGGAIARGRRRLGLLLGGLALFMGLVAVATFVLGRTGPGLLSLLVAAVPLVAWRLSVEGVPRTIELAGDRLLLELAGGREELPLDGVSARRLTADEIVHLERLATTAGIVAGNGGFDSHRLGELHLFASDLANAVLVCAEERSLVVTPDQPERFLAALGTPAA